MRAGDAGLAHRRRSGNGQRDEGVTTHFLRMETNVFSLEPSDGGSSCGLCADESETVLAGVDVAGGEEDDVEGIVPCLFRTTWK